MLQLSPGETFPVVRVLKDHTDTNTYFTRAVVKDASTLTVLATLNLTDQGNRTFSKNYTVPFSGVNGNGRYIVIITTVYNDSGYTDKSLNYQEEAETYLVQDRWNPLLGGAGGGGSIDESFFKRLINDVLDQREAAVVKVDVPDENEPPGPVLPTMQEVADGLLAAFKAELAGVVGSIQFPENEPVDFSGVQLSIANVLKELNARPKFKETNIAEIVRAIDEMRAEFVKIVQDNKKSMETFFGKFKEEILSPLMDENVQMKFADALKSGKVELKFGDNTETAKMDKKKESFIKSLMGKL